MLRNETDRGFYQRNKYLKTLQIQENVMKGLIYAWSF